MATAKSGPDQNATIAAIATPPGPGGIGIVRISGPEARAILVKLFRPHRDQPLTSHHLTYGWLIDPETGQPLDEVMAVFMKAPHSYTREDVVEIQCHSSYLLLQQILGHVLAAGATLSEPGEFTKRAFLNGRIDLTQAEAVIDLLEARTGAGANIALSQLQGALHERIATIRQSLLEIKGVLEVAIDFPDDEVEIIDRLAMLDNIRQNVITPLDKLLSAAEHGKIYREGISVVILGRPNVGKSSLLNSLLKEDRAIVTEIPGTTRDIIEEHLSIKGMPVKIVDTAGIRETTETVEEHGINRAHQQKDIADLVLMVLDASAELADADLAILKSIGPRPAILVVNKTDLVAPPDLLKFRESLPELPTVEISAKTHAGLDSLENIVFETVTGKSGPWDPGHDCVPNLRHRQSLEKGLQATRQLTDALSTNLSPDLVAIEVQTALENLSDVIGETTTDDVLDMIFTRFCLGK